MPFETGREYNRKQHVHDVYGGQAQSGIVTPRQHPLIFIFTSPSGEAHGYRDEFQNDGTFLYTGQGQAGDMQWVSGNKAIRDHHQDGKQIHVFERSRKAHVRYIGQGSYLSHHFEERPDTAGGRRQAIVFRIAIVPDDDNILDGVPTDVIVSPDEQKALARKLKGKTLAELRAAASSSAPVTAGASERVQNVYYRSEALTQYARARSGGTCEGCLQVAPFETKAGPYLECHHVNRRADGGPNLPENVVAICPNCHRRAHYSTDAGEFNNSLHKIALAKERTT